MCPLDCPAEKVVVKTLYSDGPVSGLSKTTHVNYSTQNASGGGGAFKCFCTKSNYGCIPISGIVELLQRNLPKMHIVEQNSTHNALLCSRFVQKSAFWPPYVTDWGVITLFDHEEQNTWLIWEDGSWELGYSQWFRAVCKRACAWG